MLRLLVAAALMAVSACATVDPTDYDATRARIVSEHNPYLNETSYTAPLAMLRTTSGAYTGNYYLRAARRDGNTGFPEVVQLYVDTTVPNYGGPGFNAAHTLGGETIALQPLAADVTCGGVLPCTWSETVGLNLTAGQFRRFVQSGLSVQISGRGGRVAFDVPAEYFRAFGAAIAVQ